MRPPSDHTPPHRAGLIIANTSRAPQKSEADWRETAVIKIS